MRKLKQKLKNQMVLVGVLKNQQDLEILLREHWYRIPAKHMPANKFSYLAFYQPAVFGKWGRRIQYYAKVNKKSVLSRGLLLPAERNHPSAAFPYFRIFTGAVKKLPRPIKNKPPRRVYFGFTTLSRLRKARNMLQLFNIAPTEQMVGKAMGQAGIKTKAQHYVLGRRRYRLDFAVFCKNGAVAVECDNKKAHQGHRQRQKDKIKDEYLAGLGWDIVRLREEEIITDVKKCVFKIHKLVKGLGGQ